MPIVRGCHLVGSVPVEDTRTVLETCSKGLPNRLKRITDGETGYRRQFIEFQAPLFPPFIMKGMDVTVNLLPFSKDFTEEQVQEGMRLLDEMGPKMETGYDTAAIDSYQVFKQLKSDGVLPPHIKFQISIPSLGSVIVPFISNQFAYKAEKLYEAAIFKAIRNILQTLPHAEIAYQLDAAADMLLYADAGTEPWWADQGKDYMVDYIARMANQIDKDVDMGIHLCYGDIGGKHLVEPESLAAVAEFATKIFDKCTRPVTFMHCPVPLSAIDKLDSYFKPLEALVPRLQKDGTELYLGVVHANNLEATKKMIEAAGKVTKEMEFGVATECGWGRTPKEKLGSIMEISTAVSDPLEDRVVKGSAAGDVGLEKKSLCSCALM